MPTPFDENSGFQRYLKLFTGFFYMPVESSIAYAQDAKIKMVRTCINTVQFLANIRLKGGVAYPADTLLGTIPADVRPSTTILVHAGVYEGSVSTWRPTGIRITSSGEVRTIDEINARLANTVYIYLNGESYNISRNYYGSD